MENGDLAEYAEQTRDQARGLLRWAVQVTIFVLIFAACLFVSANSLDWVMGCLYVGLLAATQLLTAVALLPRHPELLTERARHTGPRDLDRVLAGIMALWGPAITLIVAGLDRRFGWSSLLSPGIQVGALAVVTLASLLTVWAMASNRHFYGVFRVDRQQGHDVASSGPYRFVRHPGYLGALVFVLMTPLALASGWAFIPAVLTGCAIVARTSIEDGRLQQELDGYQRYALQVRYRLVPFIW